MIFPVSKKKETDYSQLLSVSIHDTFRMLNRVLRDDPTLLLLSTRIFAYQRRAEKIRQKNAENGLQVPAVIMLSLTARCNLSCLGCYMRAQHRDLHQEMTGEQLERLVAQGIELGVSFMVIAGGEPLLRKEKILTLASMFPDMIFATFTNGLLIDEILAGEFSRRRNVVPIISIDGGETETDMRRSDGVYKKTEEAFSHLKAHRTFFGTSITVTRDNFVQVTGESFVNDLVLAGCRIVTYVEYIPVESGTEGMAITAEQRQELTSLVKRYSCQFPALFLSFPGDEEHFGGCLAAGRGFVHIGPSGDLEPCPAAPMSDQNITKVPLKEALQSELLSCIRADHDLLREGEGGCALWKRQEQAFAPLRSS